MIIIRELEYGGTQRQILELVRGLDQGRYRVTICCLSRVLDMQREFEAAGFPVTVINKRWKFDVSIVWRLVRYMRVERVDLVHTFLFTADTWGRLAARFAGVREVIASARNVSLWKKWLHWRIDEVMGRWTRFIVANSKDVRDHILKNTRIAREKLKVIYNGLDARRFAGSLGNVDLRQECRIPPRAVIVGMVCRMVPQKNVLYAAEIIAQLSAMREQAHFVIVGDGPLLEEMQAALAGPLRANRVTFLGERRDVPDLLRRFDVFMLCSRHEGLSNSVMEAMGAGLPVVATSVGGNAELIEHGVTGFVCPLDDRSAFVEALTHLVDDAEARKTLGVRGRQRVQALFSVEKMVAETSRLYETCLDGDR